ncbi:unnamed protein product [Sphenostylis stenocarpa]|uniref:Ankyrin repeat domain-containing protein n=1 Tax=Sphenostylis stenocarpa TaxID=92480 RepID=A0AA86T4T9_9FABA|nr:unnamed protein product [Sphenostylis stenocarpa]
MAGIDVSAYDHSPVHKAVVLKDHIALVEILGNLPKLCNPFEIKTEAESIAEDEKAATISLVVDRRDVPNGDTPLHLAVKEGDFIATEMLMDAGANGRLKNREGWTALREAIIHKQDKIAMVIIRNYWNDYDKKYYRRLPRYIGTMRRMKDFYMEITFHFESSVIPFISRIAPSDTYKIWKKGGDMRADMTLAGFDGLKMKRANQSILFLSDGTKDDQRRYPGSLFRVSHEEKEVVVFSPTKVAPTDRQVKNTLNKKSRTDSVRIGIDVSEALLVPQVTWRGKERKETVGPWKAKVYDMQNVVLSVKSKRVPGAPPLEPKQPCKEKKKKDSVVLTEEEKKQLEAAMNSTDDNGTGHKSHHAKKEKKAKSGGHKDHKKKNTNAPSENSASQKGESQFKRGMMPALWLSQNFPLTIDELLPMLDILAEKLKAVRRLRELLTTKLPKESFPVKVAIPVVSTVRVYVTFTKFEELQPENENENENGDEFESAPSSPTSGPKNQEEEENSSNTSSSWFQWIKTPSRSSSSSVESGSRLFDEQDLFAIPPGYKFVTIEEKLKKKGIE